MTDICTKAVSSNGQNEAGYPFHKQHRQDVLFRLDSRHVSTIVYPVATVRQARGQVLTTEAPGVGMGSVAMSLACHIGTEKFPTRHHLTLCALLQQPQQFLIDYSLTKTLFITMAAK